MFDPMLAAMVMLSLYDQYRGSLADPQLHSAPMGRPSTSDGGPAAVPVNSGGGSSSLTSSINRDPSTWLRRPMRNGRVSELQRLLKAAGFDPGPIDGYFGPVTERAVRAFQRAAGIVVDGKVGPQTLNALLGGSAPQPSASTPTGSSGAPPAVAGPEAPVPPTIDGMLSWARSKIGTPYAAVNPFRFGDVPWDGQPHRSVNGSGTVWNYPAGTQVFDCSGFVVAAYRQIGVDLAKWGATTSSSIASSPHLQTISRDQLRPGDLITYSSRNGVGHVVIYLGNGQTIESTGSKGVTIGTVDWSRANTFKRVPIPGG
jgi:peptidoglycan hydrolase-like protein with peptidoglycan-binding domain